MKKIAEYKVERLAVYSGYYVRGQIKTLSVYEEEPSQFIQKIGYKVQIGNGKLYWCHDAANHADQIEFHFGNTKPQRWVKIWGS